MKNFVAIILLRSVFILLDDKLSFRCSQVVIPIVSSKSSKLWQLKLIVF